MRMKKLWPNSLQISKMSSFSNCNQRFDKAHKERILLGWEQIPPIGMSIQEDLVEKPRIKSLIVRIWHWEGHNQCKNKSCKEFHITKAISINCNNSRTSYKWLTLIHTANSRQIRFNNSNLSIQWLLFKSHPSINIASYFSKMLLSLTRV